MPAELSISKQYIKICKIVHGRGRNQCAQGKPILQGMKSLSRGKRHLDIHTAKIKLSSISPFCVNNKNVKCKTWHFHAVHCHELQVIFNVNTSSTR